MADRIQTGRNGAFVAYPPIEHHGVIGDRRTAALVAADGTVDWWCVPDYDGIPVFAALLDAERGGVWRIGPSSPTMGDQRYEDGTAVLTTTWKTTTGTLVLTDAMLWPEDVRAAGDAHHRVIVRTLTCTNGSCDAVCEVRPRANFEDVEPPRRVLQKVEESVGDLGLLAEEIDARDGSFLGNTPLLFAQVEYVRAVMEVANATPFDSARLMLGMAEQRIRRMIRRL